MTSRANSLPGNLGAAFLDSKLHDLCDQIVGNRLIKRELDGAFGMRIRRKLLLKFLGAAGCGIETDVLFERRKVNQVAV